MNRVDFHELFGDSIVYILRAFEDLRLFAILHSEALERDRDE